MKKETDGDRVRQVLAEWRGVPDGGGAYNMAGERVVSGFYGRGRRVDDPGGVQPH